MHKRINFLFLILLFLLINICVVSASDVNVTDDVVQLSPDNANLELSQDIDDVISDNEIEENTKTTPVITTNNNIPTKQGSLHVTLKDKNGSAMAGEDVTININNKDYVVKTNSKGVASMKIGLLPKTYKIQVSYGGNDKHNSVNSTFDVSVVKTNLQLTCLNTTVLKNNYAYFYLKDSSGTPISGKKVGITITGVTYYRTTDSKGMVSIKLGLNPKIYNTKLSYGGDKFYNSVSKTFRIAIPWATTITIGNTKLLTNGFMRIYLKSDHKSSVANKDIIISINNTKYYQKTSSEGFIIFNPGLKEGNYRISATFKGTTDAAPAFSVKNFKCIKGNPVNPLEKKLPLVNGVPDIDSMIKGYVWAYDGEYTLTKAQYKDVLKRDSYCLYLNNDLSRYTFFKSKSEPGVNHLIVREKWNVIERAINTKIVKANTYNYWPDEITVNTKGKSYSYSVVRDEQNTGYTCGPTSCSICSQALRNYFNEQYLANLAGSNPYDGSSTNGLKIALEKNSMKCSYFYKSSYNTALKELAKGGCALIFHTWNHYVAIVDISADGKKVLVVNPSGDYDHGSHSIPTKWLSVDYMYGRFNNYDTSSLIVKLNYNLASSTKNLVNNFYSSMGSYNKHNTNERVPQIGK